MIEPGKPQNLTDVELLEALELGASRIRMAAAADLRHVGDALAGLALAAAARLRDVLELEGISRVTRPPAAPGGMLGKVRGVVLHADGRLTCELEVNGAGAEFIRQIRGGDPTKGIGFHAG